MIVSSLRNRILSPIAFLLLVGALISCAPQASDGELKQMCEHLVTLREHTNIETDVEECIAEAKKEGVSKKQALCRISAVNKLEYWNRCRTGEARTPIGASRQKD